MFNSYKILSRNVVVSAVALLTAGTAVAGEGLTSEPTFFGLSNVSHSAAADLNTCLEATEASAREMRACTKSIRQAIPNFELRSQLYNKRATLYLSRGDYERASKDYTTAAKLSENKGLAEVGQGYAALMRGDMVKARAYFDKCSGNGTSAHLALYGLAALKEMSGDTAGAIEDYRQVVALKPEWSAAQERLSKVSTGL